MHRNRWNKLMNRAQRAYRRLPRGKRTAMKRRWLAWAERVTGCTCFWLFS